MWSQTFPKKHFKTILGKREQRQMVVIKGLASYGRGNQNKQTKQNSEENVPEDIKL
jgi:hypothetical protein